MPISWLSGACGSVNIKVKLRLRYEPSCINKLLNINDLAAHSSSKPHLNAPQRPLYGILLILVSCLLFSSQDGISKYLTLFYSPILVVWMRFVIQVGLTAAVFVPRMGVSILHTKQLKLQLARGVCMVTASVSFVVGLLYVPIGEA